MRATRRRAFAVTCAIVLILQYLNITHAQSLAWSFNPEAYQALVDTDSPQTIPPNSRISSNNWEQYKNFLPIGLQALFSRSYQWRVPKGADGEIVVGPTVAVSAPYKFRRDTEQYDRTAKLTHGSGDQIGISGYIAGLPFAHIRSGDTELVYKLMYNSYFHYHPAILYYRQRGLLFDTYLNRTDTMASAVEFKLNHVSDEGYPSSEPLAPGDFFFTSNFTVQAPEQSKYSVNLQIYYDNPDKLQDVYTYIPSLRRSIRRSSAARCSPILGTDLVQDDLYPRPVLLSQFSYRVLAHKKVLFQVHANQQYLFDESSYNLNGAPGWPKPVLGPWELRSVWVVEERTRPSYGDYCYGSRVSYLDDEQFLYLGAETYNRSLQLWKVYNTGFAPGSIDDGHGSVSTLLNTRSMVLDLINGHATATIQLESGRANSRVPAKYRDVQVWALPAGLPQMNQ
jgi:hypothetical protein